jgi:hypothetical protein
MSTPTESLTTPSTSDPSAIASNVRVSLGEYMQHRVAVKVDGYYQGAKKQRRWYQLTSLAAIIGSATVPVLIALNERQIPIIGIVGVNIPLAATIISLIVTILVAAEKLFRFREHWRSYDTVSAALQYEQLLFQTRAGAYAYSRGQARQRGRASCTIRQPLRRTHLGREEVEECHGNDRTAQGARATS